MAGSGAAWLGRNPAFAGLSHYPSATRPSRDQTAGRVFLFLNTDDFWRDFRSMKEKGVNFCEEQRRESCGLVAVFEDLYGNRWDLLELAA